MNNGGFVDTKISHALTFSWAQLHNVSDFGGVGSIFLSSKRITDQRKVLGEILLSKVIFESALISP